jgi:hypothetical protein
MKSYFRIFFASILIMAICQTNAPAQGLKGLLNKTKSAVTPKAKGSSAVKEPSAGPAKPLAPEVKNSVSELRSYTGLTKEAFVAKMKSQGFVLTQDPMAGEAYKSKSGYLLSAEYGTRGNSQYVRTAKKMVTNKSPNLATVKTTFLDLGKQCTALKANYTGGWVKANERKGTNKTSKTADDRISKFLPAFDTMIATKEDGGAVDQYSEKDYDYNLTYMFAKVMGSILTIEVTDLTIESQFG